MINISAAVMRRISTSRGVIRMGRRGPDGYVVGVAGDCAVPWWMAIWPSAAARRVLQTPIGKAMSTAVPFSVNFGVV
jgi:hypothetical protein